MTSSGFEAVEGPDARVLILGSLPGADSLARGEYYAHPRNAFWRIMAELVGAAPALPYNERLRVIVKARIALWDVCASATRSGSLDSAIQSRSDVPNDIAGFLRSHGRVHVICFNGAKAAELFRRKILRDLPSPMSAIPRLTLPSTSPAYAAMPFQAKLRAWRAAVAAASLSLQPTSAGARMSRRS